jgi:hypothetical protein
LERHHFGRHICRNIPHVASVNGVAKGILHESHFVGRSRAGVITVRHFCALRRSTAQIDTKDGRHHPQSPALAPDTQGDTEGDTVSPSSIRWVSLGYHVFSVGYRNAVGAFATPTSCSIPAPSLRLALPSVAFSYNGFHDCQLVRSSSSLSLSEKEPDEDYVASCGRERYEEGI